MYEQLPSKLKKRPQFCNWRLEERDDDLTKVPYRSNGKRANPTDPQCFTDFDTVCAAHDKYDGIGIGIFDDLFAIDIDHCVTDGVLSPMAQDIIETMDCYTEYSPSGKGIRIIGLISELRYDKARYYINNRKLGLEVYVAGYTNKFVTLTGNALRESDLVDRSKELMTILEKYMVKPAQFQEVIRDVPGSYLSDEAVIAKALASKQGEKFRSLREGNIPEGMSHSEADLSYCTMLAFWCGGDTYQMDRLFQESGLMRDKWNREDYRTATLNKAVAMTTEFYKPLAISDAREDFSIPASFLAQVKPENNDRYPWTEIGYGRLFADCYRDVARFVPERKSWYCYRNGIWAADTGNLQTMELCKDLADALMLHALTIRNERQRQDYIKLCAAKWQIRRTRETILRDAQSIHPISIQEFDSDPYVFNCRNGTLHLDTMEFASHNPEDRLTKISPVDYDPNAHCDRFLTFVDEITSGDTDKGRFLQKMLGYGMSGDTRFECLFILYGATTRNGKGTLCESVLKVLGTYGCTARPETLSMKANANSHNPSEDIARLAGVRFANISEPGKGMVLNAAQVKSILIARLRQGHAAGNGQKRVLRINVAHIQRGVKNNGIGGGVQPVAVFIARLGDRHGLRLHGHVAFQPVQAENKRRLITGCQRCRCKRGKDQQQSQQQCARAAQGMGERSHIGASLEFRRNKIRHLCFNYITAVFFRQCFRSVNSFKRRKFPLCVE